MDVEIVNLFGEIFNLDETVRLYKTYKGVPFSCEASIYKIGRKNLFLKVGKYQALCIRVCGDTFI
jgi:hypothetical protein